MYAKSSERRQPSQDEAASDGSFVVFHPDSASDLRSRVGRASDGRTVWGIWRDESDRTRGGLFQSHLRRFSYRASPLPRWRVWQRNQPLSQNRRLRLDRDAPDWLSVRSGYAERYSSHGG